MMEPVDFERVTFAWRYPPRPAPKPVRSLWRYWGLALGLCFTIMAALAAPLVIGKAVGNLAHFNANFEGGEE